MNTNNNDLKFARTIVKENTLKHPQTKELTNQNTVNMKIGEIAKKSGFSKDTLRYYEKIGLLHLNKKQRSENNYRIYDDTILNELKVIKKMKSIGFTLSEIKDLRRMEELNFISCQSVAPLINNKLEKIEAQLMLLQKQKKNLLLLKEFCQGNCTATFEQFTE